MTVITEDTARHEARHLAAAVLLGLPVQKATAIPSGKSEGRVTVGPLAQLDFGHDQIRKLAIATLVGYLDEPDWPPAWPPNKKGPRIDEIYLATYADVLKLDEAGWQKLITDAYYLAAEPEFGRYEGGAAVLLEQGCEIDERLAKQIHAIAEDKVQHLTTKATAMPTTDRGAFTAIAAAYSIDRVGDRIVPGAFANTIERWKASSRQIPLQWNHESSAASVIGSVNPATMRETGEGLYVEGQLDLNSSDTAQEAWRSIKAERVALSFGFLALNQNKAADGVNELLELDVFEISIVPAPANADTRFLSFKSMLEPLFDRATPTTEDLRRRCEDLGVLPREKAVDPRPMKTATFDV